MTMPGSLLLVGGGRMGKALLDGWLERGLPRASTVVIEPDAERAAALAERGVEVHPEISALPEGFDPRVLVLAVKPQVMADVLDELHARLVQPALVVSIAAGKPLAVFEAAFGSDIPIVRVMPNTPAAIGRGISALFANAATGATDRRAAEDLMAAVGDTVWLESEDDMHAVTALSGGGPAYVFLLVEAMAVAGERLGLDSELAMRLARTTVAGAAALMESSDTTPASLRRAVTSPGGTTRAALDILMPTGDDADDDEEEPMGLAELMTEALAAAAERSRELG